MKTAEEILKEIHELSNAERWKLLELLYEEYYNVDKYFPSTASMELSEEIRFGL